MFSPSQIDMAALIIQLVVAETKLRRAEDHNTTDRYFPVIQCIKRVREKMNLGLYDAKQLTEHAAQVIGFRHASENYYKPCGACSGTGRLRETHKYVDI